MKRLITWMLLLGLLVSPGMAAGEPVSEKHDVFDVYDLSVEAGGWMGAAVPLLSGLLLTSEANLPEAAENTGLSDGTGFWNARAVFPTGKGHLAFISYDADPEPSSVSSWPFWPRTALPEANEIYVYHVNRAGDQIYRSVSLSAPLSWEDLDCMILTLDGEAAPGDPVLTDGGELAGVIAAEYAEGWNRYVAVSAQGIMSLMVQLYTQPGAGKWTDQPEEGFSVTAAGNQVTFDWSGVRKEAPEGKNVWLVVLDTGNDYLNYVRADGEKTNHTMLLTPGRTYVSGLVVSGETPAVIPEQYAVTALPEAEPLTEYGFRPVLTTLAFSENGESMTERIEEPVRTITPEELRAGSVHFYSWSVYETAEKREDTLLITLTTPDGINFQYPSGWIYDPAYMAEDIWSVPLKTAGFLEALEKKGYPFGTYQMAFYVGGRLADSFVFEIK